MIADRDQLRFLCGMNKTLKVKNKKPVILVKGIDAPNPQAIYAFREKLEDNIKYYKGEIGGGAKGDILTPEQVDRYAGTCRFCEFELTKLKNKYKNFFSKAKAQKGNE